MNFIALIHSASAQLGWMVGYEWMSGWVGERSWERVLTYSKGFFKEEDAIDYSAVYRMLQVWQYCPLTIPLWHGYAFNTEVPLKFKENRVRNIQMCMQIIKGSFELFVQGLHAILC